MRITYRHYEGSQDMALQYRLWEELTRELPYAWKPTLSPRMFEHDPKFDSRTKIFAFDGNDPVGYIAFSGSGEFVSFGYPWVKPGYEQLREELFERLFTFASGTDYGGKVFAQRFREQWKEQLDFFQSKGFTIEKRSPIFVAPVKNVPLSTSQNDIEMEVKPSFSFGHYIDLVENATPEQMSMLELYYSSVDFDFSIAVKASGELRCYMGITVRKDTGFSEIIAASFRNPIDQTLISDAIRMLIVSLVEVGATHVAIGSALVPDTKMLEELGFKEQTADILVFKNVAKK